MRFGTLLELQYPRPWIEDGERQFFNNVLEQVELTDKADFDSVWEVEHHFLEEYAHSSAPEVFLGAISQRTKQLRIGHGIVLMPPGYNQTARIAERIATLDLVSNGRVEFGTGESSSRAELEGYGVPLELKRRMWLEATEQVANMLAMDPYPGFDGEFFSMPTRNIVPKVVQKPHPPMWMACSNHEQIKLAARLGLGALGFALVDPVTAKSWIDEYYQIIKTECVPISHTVNANVALTSPLSLDNNEEAARERGFEGRYFFTFASNHHYVDGVHKPGRTNIWEQYQTAWPMLKSSIEGYGAPSTIGTPAQARELVKVYEDMGCDEILFMAQMGNMAHEDICESLQLFASEVLPEFKESEAERQRIKGEELAPYIEAALARKEWMQPLNDSDIPEYKAFSRQVAESGKARAGEVDEDHWVAAIDRLMRSTGAKP
jgi:alkanesulfonate monooxygenase SsuD/methylene tetrahydromethanopterin reductase-like flavin-dependent oxidoreductase (luciferase family)